MVQFYEEHEMLGFAVFAQSEKRKQLIWQSPEFKTDEEREARFKKLNAEDIYVYIQLLINTKVQDPASVADKQTTESKEGKENKSE